MHNLRKVILDQKAHQEEIDQLKGTHGQDITRLKYEQLEISAYNENIE
jgi:hypothetical protein